MNDCRVSHVRRVLFCAYLCAVGVTCYGMDWLYIGTTFVFLGMMIPILITEACPCTCCNTGTRTAQVQATFTGVTTSGICSNTRCGTNYNTTTTLDYNYQTGSPNSECCRYIGDTNGAICQGTIQDPGFIYFWWKIDSASTRRIIVYHDAGDATGAIFDASSDCPRDCGNAVTGMTCTSNCSTVQGCDFTSASGDITPI